jgi:hypothetical protein
MRDLLPGDSVSLRSVLSADSAPNPRGRNLTCRDRHESGYLNHEAHQLEKKTGLRDSEAGARLSPTVEVRASFRGLALAETHGRAAVTVSNCSFQW